MQASSLCPRGGGFRPVRLRRSNFYLHLRARHLYNRLNGTVGITGTVTNTGTTDITGISGFSTNVGTLGPHLTSAVFGTSGNASLNAEFAGIDLKPGGTFSFIFATESFANAPSGSFSALVNSGLSLRDAQGGTPLVPSTNTPFINVITPEPSTFALLATGVLGAFGAARRRLTR